MTSFFAVRMYEVQRGPPLSVWHTYVPNEMRKIELDATWRHRCLSPSAWVIDVHKRTAEYVDRMAMSRHWLALDDQSTKPENVQLPIQSTSVAVMNAEA